MKALFIGLVSISGILYASSVTAPVAVGELIDKITILEIKAERLGDADKKAHALFELSQLKETLTQAALTTPTNQQEFNTLRHQLLTVNKKKWDIENAIRAKEAQKTLED